MTGADLAARPGQVVVATGLPRQRSIDATGAARLELLQTTRDLETKHLVLGGFPSMEVPPVIHFRDFRLGVSLMNRPHWGTLTYWKSPDGSGPVRVWHRI